MEHMINIGGMTLDLSFLPDNSKIDHHPWDNFRSNLMVCVTYSIAIK